MTQAQKFAKTQTLHTVIWKSDLVGVEGNPKATAWDSFGQIEGITFADGSVYWHHA